MQTSYLGLKVQKYSDEIKCDAIIVIVNIEYRTFFQDYLGNVNSLEWVWLAVQTQM